MYNPERQEAEYICVEAGTMIIDNSLLEKNKEHCYRLTVGHEGGHYILHRFYSGYIQAIEQDRLPIVQCRVDLKKVSYKPSPNWTDIDWMDGRLTRYLPPSSCLAAA